MFLTVVFLFIALLFVELLRVDSSNAGTSNQESLERIIAIKVDYHLLTAVSIFIFAYSFQFMVFPAYSELENRSNKRFACSSLVSIVIYTVALVSTGTVSVFLFGKELKPDLLDNLATRPSGVSVFLRTVYCLILIFHLPYIFFTVKEYILVMYDELVSSSLST